MNDTIRLGAIVEGGRTYPIIFLDELIVKGEILDPAEKIRRNKIRNDLYAAYPYALAAGAILKDVNSKLDKLDARRDRKKYLKTIDRTLDATFKEPLKSLSIDQGHILIKLISRQTGQNCYSIIRELKGGVSAMVWQSVGVFFNNNLVREYDPEGRDKELEKYVQELEASNFYRFQVYQQEAIMRQIGGVIH